MKLEKNAKLVMIGTNDVWRQFDSPGRTETHVGPDEYARTLDELVTRTLPNCQKLGGEAWDAAGGHAGGL